MLFFAATVYHHCMWHSLTCHSSQLFERTRVISPAITDNLHFMSSATQKLNNAKSKLGCNYWHRNAGKGLWGPKIMEFIFFLKISQSNLHADMCCN